MRRRIQRVRCSRIGVAVACAAFLIVPAGSSASTELAREYLLDGPQLAGGRVFFMTGFGRDGYALRVPGETGPVRTVARGREPGPGKSRAYSFEAAPGRIGVEGSRIRNESDSGTSDPSAGATVEYHRSRLLVGSAPRALTPVARCDGAGTSFPYAVGQSFVAFVDHCPSSELGETGSPSLRYLDYSAGTPSRRSVTLQSGRFTPDDFVDRLRVAGQWAAVDASVPNSRPPPPYDFSPTVVVDLAAGREAYRVERYQASSGAPRLETDGAAIDSDGTLVTVSGADEKCTGTLAFHTPAEPFRHPLAGRVCAPAVEVDRGAFLYLGFAGGRHALMLGSVDGRTPRPVALGGPGIVQSFDVEDGRVVYGLDTCGKETAVRISSPDAGEVVSPLELGCPVRLASRRVRVSRRGSLTLRLRCPRGCDVSARLVLRVMRSSRHGRVRTTAYSGTASRGPRARVRFLLTRRQRSRLVRGVSRGHVTLSSSKLGLRGYKSVRSKLRVVWPYQDR